MLGLKQDVNSWMKVVCLTQTSSPLGTSSHTARRQRVLVVGWWEFSRFHKKCWENWQVQGSSKSWQFILTGTWISAPNFTAMCPIFVSLKASKINLMVDYHIHLYLNELSGVTKISRIHPLRAMNEKNVIIIQWLLGSFSLDQSDGPTLLSIL